ncbi:MAG: radical SAM family heme chaperone HemW [Gemmatimonadetes bacterium]|nr:radical SAM family heme chaperone HemW [Gemmatimonadota bacterium]
MPPAHLYVHVPFCLRRCSYCDFAVTATREPPIAAWLDAIDAELTLLAEAEGWTAPLELRTLYIGGGTPSLLGLGAMRRLRERLERHARWDDATVEWTAEANPETLTPALAADWRAAGVNRISLGAQTFHEPTLRWMGRLHGADGPARAVAACRAAGVDNISIDLIFGLPARLGRDWDADLSRALALEPTHVSLYGLTAEAGTPLGRWVAEGRERMVDEDAYAAEYLLAVERMRGAGFEHYEVSNFALRGRQSAHNGAYWTGAAYVGLGPGAHSFLPPVRRWNERDWLAYRRSLDEGRLPRAGEERIDAAAARLESIWLGLRTSAGLALEGLNGAQRRLTERWVVEGWAEVGGGRVRLTPNGWLLLDRLAVELDARAA